MRNIQGDYMDILDIYFKGCSEYTVNKTATNELKDYLKYLIQLGFFDNVNPSLSEIKIAELKAGDKFQFFDDPVLHQLKQIKQSGNRGTIVCGKVKERIGEGIHFVEHREEVDLTDISWEWLDSFDRTKNFLEKWSD